MTTTMNVAAPVLRVVGATKLFGAVVALDGVDLEVSSGEVLALLGDNGAGKSTLIKCISGVHKLDRGELWLDGLPVQISSASHAREHGIETVYQDLALFDNLNPTANFFAGREKSGPTWLPRGRCSGSIKRGMTNRTRELLDRLQVRLPDFDADVALMSGGQTAGGRGRPCGGVLLQARHPRRADCCPRAAGVGSSARAGPARLKDDGVAVILISHSMDHVMAVADRAMVMRRGRKIGEAAAHRGQPRTTRVLDRRGPRRQCRLSRTDLTRATALGFRPEGATQVTSPLKVVAGLGVVAILIAGCSSSSRSRRGLPPRPDRRQHPPPARRRPPRPDRRQHPPPARRRREQLAAHQPCGTALVVRPDQGHPDHQGHRRLLGRHDRRRPQVRECEPTRIVLNDAGLQDQRRHALPDRSDPGHGHQGCQGDRDLPDGPGRRAALLAAQQAGVKIVFVDNTIDGITPTAISATDNVKGGQKAGAYIKTQLKSGDTIGLMIAVKGVPNLDQRIDGVANALKGTGVKVVYRRPADHVRPEDRCSGRSGPADQVPEPHRALLGLRLPGRGCCGRRQAEGREPSRSTATTATRRCPS